MSSGAYNRNKGHDYERQIARELRMRKFFPGAITSRSGSRGEDPQGIDIVRTGMFNIQVKARQNLNLFDILYQDMPDNQNINVVFWKRNRQKDIVCMDEEGFYELLQILKRERIL